MATIRLVNGPQLDRAKICDLCPTKPKIWPRSKFDAHLKEAHDPENSRRCWKCGQVQAGREFLNQSINTCNTCRQKRMRIGVRFGRNRKGKRDHYNIGLKGRTRV
jgi:hypothetical protein